MDGSGSPLLGEDFAKAFRNKITAQNSPAPDAHMGMQTVQDRPAEHIGPNEIVGIGRFPL